MGGGALTVISRSISEVRVEFGQAAFPLRMRTHLQIHNQRAHCICDVVRFGKQIHVCGFK